MGANMKLIKSLIKKVFAFFDIELVRNKHAYVSFNNFENITIAYEFILNKHNPEYPLSKNETRSKLLSRLLGTPPSEAYFIIDAIERTKTLEGDVCEFGVAQGETSALIANEIIPTKKILHLFDSFEGLPKPTDKDSLKDDIFSLGSMDAYTGTMSCPEDMVVSRLKAISFPENRYKIHKGFIERVILNEVNLPEKVSFAYIDFDLYLPILVTLNYLHYVMRSGSMIVVDDYDYFSTGVKTAIKEFLDDKDPDKRFYDLFVPDNQLGYFAILTKR